MIRETTEGIWLVAYQTLPLYCVAGQHIHPFVLWQAQRGAAGSPCSSASRADHFLSEILYAAWDTTQHHLSLRARVVFGNANAMTPWFSEISAVKISQIQIR